MLPRGSDYIEDVCIEYPVCWSFMTTVLACPRALASSLATLLVRLYFRPLRIVETVFLDDLSPVFLESCDFSDSTLFCLELLFRASFEFFDLKAAPIFCSSDVRTALALYLACFARSLAFPSPSTSIDTLFPYFPFGSGLPYEVASESLSDFLKSGECCFPAASSFFFLANAFKIFDFAVPFFRASFLTSVVTRSPWLLFRLLRALLDSDWAPDLGLGLSSSALLMFFFSDSEALDIADRLLRFALALLFESLTLSAPLFAFKFLPADSALSVSNR